ncbi:hypothetical protein [Photorhabdus sp. RM323S]|uniref:hypothetical protein n=1 Tax=Photorhabdus sp. RM323S TaxID=3342828 RepID=UPI0036DE827B
MTLFTRKLGSPAHTKRQFVKAQHLPVLEVLDERNWVPFERHYASTGRALFNDGTPALWGHERPQLVQST